MNLIALLPKDRNQTGTIQLWRNGSMIERFSVLGCSDQREAERKKNPTRNPELPYGHTPTGTWTVRVGIIKADAATYGPHPVFMLWPTGGQALKSYAPPNRRSGIWLHGGAMNAAGGLRPTLGCLRVSDATMARLHELSKQYGRIETLETKEV